MSDDNTIPDDDSGTTVVDEKPTESTNDGVCIAILGISRARIAKALSMGERVEFTLVAECIGNRNRKMADGHVRDTTDFRIETLEITDTLAPREEHPQLFGDDGNELAAD